MFRARENSNRPLLPFIVAVAIVLMAVLLRQIVVQYFGLPLSPFITLYPAVIIVALWVGPWSGLLATATGSLMAAYCIFSPGEALGSVQIADAAEMILFMCTGVCLSVLAPRLHQFGGADPSTNPVDAALRKEYDEDDSPNLKTWAETVWAIRGLSCCCGLAVFGTTLGLELWLQSRGSSSLVTVVGPDLLAGFLAGVVYHWTTITFLHRHRMVVRQRIEMISDMNHHVRNALQAIVLSVETADHQELAATINEATERITWALREILGCTPTHTESRAEAPTPVRDMPAIAEVRKPCARAAEIELAVVNGGVARARNASALRQPRS